MIKMYISKVEDGHTLMARPDVYVNVGMVKLKDVVKIVFMQTQSGITPVPCFYPNLMTKDIINKDFLKNMDIIINENDYVIFEEKNIVEDMLNMYRAEMGKRTGIELVTSMPPSSGLRLVR